MKTCKGCVFADWQKTTAGKLHPSGMGSCRKRVVIPKLPGAYSWISGEPVPYGGFIERKRELADHCPYWSPVPMMVKP